MKRIIASILFIAGAAAALEVGETGLNDLRIQPDARIQGIGGASLGVTGNSQTLYANPAGLVSSPSHVLNANYLPYPAGIHIGSVVFKPKSEGALRFAAGVFYLNSGQMTRTSPTNENMGTFGYHVLNLGGTAAYSIIENLSVGANLKLHMAAVDSNVQLAAGVDVGAMYRDLLPGLAIGFAVQNAAYEIKPFVEERSAIPLAVGGGISYVGVKNLLLAVDVSKPLDAPLIVRGGVEYMPVKFLALRGGYSTQGAAWKTGDETDILAGLSVGMGIHDLAGVSIDYSVTPGIDLGLFHRISLTYDFR